MSVLEVTLAGPIAWLTITRESARNALNLEVLEALDQAITRVESESSVRLVALTGAGEKAFVAGADIAAMAQLSVADATRFAAHGARVLARIEASSKPFAAAVNGVALGGGCELALACDFIYAASNALLGQPEVKLGVIPGFGGTQRLLRRVGVGKAKELVLTGAAISAEEALRIGLVDAVTAPGELRAKVESTAQALSANGPLAVAEAKRVMQLGQSMSLTDAVVLEQQVFGALFASADQREGMAAFLAKRTATFTGR